MKDVFIRMECLTDLPTWLNYHALTREETIRMMSSLCETLMGFEENGILHRDIKPENIFMDEEGNPRFGDFGSSGTDDEEWEDDTRPIQGTPAYMAPEVYQGKPYGHGTDLYSLGMVFYEIMNDGRAPFTNPNKQILSPNDKRKAFERRIRGEKLPMPILAKDGFGRVLVKACDPDPGSRYGSAKELKKDLALLLEEDTIGQPDISGPDKRRPGLVRYAYVLLAAVLLVGLALVIYTGFFTVRDRFQVGPDAYAGIRGDGTLVISGKGSVNLAGIGYEGSTHFPQVKEIELREGVEKIEDKSFEGMPSLAKIHFPDSLEEIGKEAFLSCPSLEEVQLPAHLKTIGNNAFSSCYGLKNVSIPESLTEIGEDAFLDTPWLEEADKDEDYLVVNHILLRYRGSEEELLIPEDMGIREISFKAFGDKTSIKKIILPDTVEKIDRQAFVGCSKLETVRLPEKLKELPEQAFLDCPSLADITLPAGLVSIGRAAFWDCFSLKKMSIPATVSYIGNQAFYGTPFLESQIKGDYAVINGILLEYYGSEKHLTLSEDLKLTGIAGRAFAGCRQLESIVLPEGITWLGEYCFFDCTALKEITFPESLERIEGGQTAFTNTAWSKDGNKVWKKTK